MKKRYLFAIAAILLLTAGVSAAVDQNVVMEIKGMTCSLCTLAVKKSLAAVEGVENVDVSYKQKTARLTASDSITDTVLVEAVRKAGYQATVVKRQPAE